MCARMRDQTLAGIIYGDCQSRKYRRSGHAEDEVTVNRFFRTCLISHPLLTTVRFDWKISPRRAHKLHIALLRNLVVEVQPSLMGKP